MSAIFKESIWPRIFLMLFYVVISTYIAFLCYFIPMIAGSEACYHYGPERCAEIKRQAIFGCVSWSIPQIFIWIGLGYFIKKAHDAKNRETHHYVKV